MVPCQPRGFSEEANLMRAALALFAAAQAARAVPAGDRWAYRRDGGELVTCTAEELLRLPYYATQHGEGHDWRADDVVGLVYGVSTCSRCNATLTEANNDVCCPGVAP
jgi:hypothetical protein